MEKILRVVKKLLPKKFFAILETPYHFFLAFLGAIIYRFPTQKLTLIGITGTKGKTTTAELVNAILEEAGFKTALAGTLRFKIGEKSKPNLFKMTMPGRFFLQRFFRDAVSAKCTHGIVEITSEGAKQFRHRFLSLNALIFTNIAPEHIESHGSYENYLNAKLNIGEQLLRSKKLPKFFIGNKDDSETKKFLELGLLKNSRLFSIKDAEKIQLSKDGASFFWRQKEIKTKLVGEFNVYNSLAALSLGEAFQIPLQKMANALQNFKGVPGRAEEVRAGQDFTVVVDYAHTPDSLEALYRAYKSHRKICVLSGTGGGRDKWKRPKMGEIASTYCESIILTDEDPYDENPLEIISDIKKGISNPNVEIETDRRVAISKALKKAEKDNVVLITGKGTDPYIMGQGGTRTPWSDYGVAREELLELLKAKSYEL